MGSRPAIGAVNSVADYREHYLIREIALERGQVGFQFVHPLANVAGIALVVAADTDKAVTPTSEHGDN